MPPKYKAHRQWLIRNGFALVRSTKHEWYEKLENGNLVITSLSHGDGEIPLPVWRKILKQLGLTEDEYNQHYKS